MVPEGRLRLGTALSEAWDGNTASARTDVEALEESLEQVRDTRPAEPLKFE